MKQKLFSSAFLRLILSIIGFASYFIVGKANAQTFSYPEYDMEGDTIWHVFPPPGGTYSPTKIVLKFRDGALNKDSLCYDCYSIIEPRTRGKGSRPLDDVSTIYFAQCKHVLMTQHFTLNIIADPLIRSILEMNGVAYLRRMTAANPCTDTLSLSRFGDTLHMDHYNWMVAEFNNDTSVVPTLTELFLAYDGTFQVAEPDYYLEQYSPRNPVDPGYVAGKQKSLAMIGMSDAWGLDIGEESITVAVVDAGVDYWRCDLGRDSIPNGKVIGGWDYLTNDMGSVYINATHGTQVASIIGALTNNFMCTSSLTSPNGMAGIAGGFGPAGTPNLGTGVKLVAYNVIENPPYWSASGAASAILESGALSIYGSYGDGVDVINMSGGTDSNSPNYSIAVRNAMSDAWKNGTSFICADADNGNQTTPVYPSYHEPASEVIAVSAVDQTKRRQGDVAWGFHTDLLAPGGEQGNGSDSSNIAYALQVDYADPSTDSDTFAYFGETSAAAPHVSGVVALLRGWMGTHDIPFAREDPEGMLKASALDLVTAHPPTDDDPTGTEYITGFDDHAGWGLLQAGQLFDMLDPSGKNSYQLAHVEIPDSVIYKPDWPSSLSNTNVVVYSATLDTNNIPDSQKYDVKIREIKDTVSYAGFGFNTGLPLYVWGNSGVGATFGSNRGVANLLPNWQERWCEVTSGKLGNQDTTIRVDGGLPYHNIGVPGIRHEYSTNVVVHTYQYQLFNHGGSTPVGYLPTTSQLGLGFTVFGSRSTSGVRSSGNSTPFTLWPSIASSRFHVSMDNESDGATFSLFDEIGREVLRENILPGTNPFEVSVSELPSGIYLGRLTSESGVEAAKIIVRH